MTKHEFAAKFTYHEYKSKFQFHSIFEDAPQIKPIEWTGCQKGGQTSRSATLIAGREKIGVNAATISNAKPQYPRACAVGAKPSLHD